MELAHVAQGIGWAVLALIGVVLFIMVSMIPASVFISIKYKVPITSLWHTVRGDLIDAGSTLAKRWLCRYDHVHRLNAAEVELVRRRDAFYAGGGSPSDPNCPDIFDVLREWGHDPLKPLPAPKA